MVGTKNELDAAVFYDGPPWNACDKHVLQQYNKEGHMRIDFVQ